jgi:hypothetical protein
MKSARRLVAALALLGMTAIPATAATFRVTLDPFVSGPIVAGQFEADAAGGPVTSVNITYDSILFTSLVPPVSSLAAPTYDATMKLLLGGVYRSGDASSLRYLYFVESASIGYFFDLNCVIGEGFCREDSLGTFSVEQISAVPVPAALPLLASGLGALGFIRWRRKGRKAAAATA